MLATIDQDAGPTPSHEDGSDCEAWALFFGECRPGEVVPVSP